MGAASVRAALGLGAGDVTIKPTDVARGCTLFVQSTSINRKLTSGQVAIFQKSKAAGSGSGGTAAASAATESATKSMKRKAGDDGGDGDGDGDDECGGGSGDGGGGEGSEDSGTVVWSRLTFPLEEEVECLDEHDLVVGASASGVPGDCDQPIPAELVHCAVDGVMLALRIDDWQPSEALSVAIPARHAFYTPPPARRLQWRSAAAGGARLMYVETQEETRFVALELREPRFGLVSGSCGAHPFVHSTSFMYANSDGSTSDRALGEVVSPAIVLAKLIHDTAMHASDAEH